MKTRASLTTLPLLLFLIGFIPLQGCVTPQGGEQPNMLSTEQEIELGDKAAQEIEKNNKILDDPVIQEYVSEIGMRLARVSPRQDVPYKFTVIDDPKTVNAFALPGGHMYIYTGLMKLCENEAQLASVMAHEIGHVACHHHGESLTRQYEYSMLVNAILGNKSSEGADMAAQIIGSLGELHFSRVQESEADRVGMDILWRAGYKPEAMVTFMQRMMQTEGEQGSRIFAPKFLSSHPATADRVARLQALVQQYPADLRAKSPVYAERYKEKVLDRLK